MIRNFQILVTLILLTWSGLSSAALDALEDGYELHVDEVSLPAHAAGRIVIRQCATCEALVHRVDEQTTYHIGVRSAPVTLADFKYAVSAGDGELLYVFFKPETGVVTRVTLSLIR